MYKKRIKNFITNKKLASLNIQLLIFLKHFFEFHSLKFFFSLKIKIRNYQTNPH